MTLLPADLRTWTMGAMLAMLSAPALADGGGTAAIEVQLRQLTATVQALAGKVDALERKLDRLRPAPVGTAATPSAAAARVPAPGTAARPTSKAPATAAAPAAAAPTRAAPTAVAAAPAAAATSGNRTTASVAEAWRHIEEGMPDHEVTALLGAPQHKFMLGGQTVWYYYYPGVGGGSISFYDNGRIASSQRPPFHGWW